MRLEWKQGGGDDVDLFDDGRLVGWIDGDNHPYEVHITYNLSNDMMPCEKTKFVTLRPAMRALRETVTILLIGRAYET